MKYNIAWYTGLFLLLITIHLLNPGNPSASNLISGSKDSYPPITVHTLNNPSKDAINLKIYDKTPVYISEKMVLTAFGKLFPMERSRFRHITHDGKSVAGLATNTALKTRFLNTFLIGYQPFEATYYWQPLEHIARKLSYRLDKDEFSGLPEIWQSSKEAYLRTRGDCEDHALLLADWLISMGYDARVVVGSVPEGGHAWVILLKDGKEFLLEATQKRISRRNRHYPLAALQTGYKPELSFNRKYNWYRQKQKWIRASEIQYPK